MKRNKVVIRNLFIIYLIVLIYLLFFHSSYRQGLNTFNIDMFSKEHLQMCNFIPLKTIITYFSRLYEHTINTDIVIKNLLGNLLLFAPIGFFVPVLFDNKINRFYKFLLLILIITIFVEIIQFITFMGSSDIDDIILNTIGAIIIYMIMKTKLVRKLLKKVINIPEQ